MRMDPASNKGNKNDRFERRRYEFRIEYFCRIPEQQVCGEGITEWKTTEHVSIPRNNSSIQTPKVPKAQVRGKTKSSIISLKTGSKAIMHNLRVIRVTQAAFEVKQIVEFRHSFATISASSCPSTLHVELHVEINADQFGPPGFAL